MLLVTAKLNNNNTEFVWWCITHPQCSQTNFYLVMVELGFDNRKTLLMQLLDAATDTLAAPSDDK